MQDRIPPQNTEAEQSVLGAILIDATVLDTVAEILKPADFYRQAHQIMYEVMLALQAKNEPIDLVTVTEELKTQHRLDDVGGIIYVTQLANCVPTSANALYHARIVVNNAVKRQLTDSGAAGRKNNDNRQQEVTEISRGLKALAHIKKRLPVHRRRPLQN